MSLSPFQLPALLSRFDETYARSYCFSAHYIYHLLVNGYKFTEETWPQIRFEKEVSANTECLLFFHRKVCGRGQRLKDALTLLVTCCASGKEVTRFKVAPRVLQTRRTLELSGRMVRLLRVGLLGMPDAGLQLRAGAQSVPKNFLVRP